MDSDDQDRHPKHSMKDALAGYYSENPPGAEPTAEAPQPASSAMAERLEALKSIAIRRNQAVKASGSLIKQTKAYVRRLLADIGEPLPLKKPVKSKHIERFSGNIVVQNLMDARNLMLEWQTLEEKAMVVASKGLPALDSFWLPVNGLGAPGYAVIISETGDLGQYATKSKLWRRMGLHPVNGKACSTWARHKGPGGLTAEQWTAVGYSKKRRSVAWQIVDSLLKRKDNSYYPRYLQYKQLERDKAQAAGLIVASSDDIPEGEKEKYMSLKHVDNRARRKIGKLLLRDLWKAWRSEAMRHPPQGQRDAASLPPSD